MPFETRAQWPPVAILHYNSIITWRQSSYYFPDDFVMYLPANPDHAARVLHQREDFWEPAPARALPGGVRRLLLLAPFADAGQLQRTGWRRSGAVYYQDIGPHQQVEIGPYRLQSGGA